MSALALTLPVTTPVESMSSPAAGLMNRVARGDQFAFAELYERHAGSVLAVIRSVLRDPSQSEEVAQEVMVEVWRTAARFDHTKGSVETWMLTMARRRAIDRVRSEQAARSRNHVVGVRDQGRPHDEVAETVEVRIEHAAVREAMASLTPLQREAVTLAWFDGMTQREVSDILDTPLGTVKTRIRDGLIRLRDALATA